MWFQVLYLVSLYVCMYPISVRGWEFIDANKQLGREWSTDLNGQNICDGYRYTYKERFFVCEEATKMVRRGRSILKRTNLGDDSALRETKCREKKVYYSFKNENGTHASALRMMYPCPTTDRFESPFFFGRGKDRNEIGVYMEVETSDEDTIVKFFGIMRDIDLDMFGKRLYRKNLRLLQMFKHIK